MGRFNLFSQGHHSYGNGGNILLLNIKQTLKPDCNGTALIRTGSEHPYVRFLEELS